MSSTDHLLSPSNHGPEYLTEDDRLLRNPVVRKQLMEVSINEDEKNPYYKCMLDQLANGSVGKIPLVIGMMDDTSFNERFENSWLDWGARCHGGQTLRLIRRGAARTGVGIGIPYVSDTLPSSQVKLKFKTYCANELKTPRPGSVQVVNFPNSPPRKPLNVDNKFLDRCFAGIYYNEHREPEYIFFEEDDRKSVAYHVQDILFWMKPSCEGQITPTAEAACSLMMYPSLRRYFNSVIREAEFNASIPMFLKIMDHIQMDIDVDKAQLYPREENIRPGTIPTLPPGVTLESPGYRGSSGEQTKMMELIVRSAARSICMPSNLALGTSENHNMSAAQVDRQNWSSWIEIDRYDFQCVVYKMIGMWYPHAFRKNVLLSSVENPLYSLAYGELFHHPDPNKVAQAGALDIASGRETLVRFYRIRGLSFEREMKRESSATGIPVDELIRMRVIGMSSAQVQLMLQDQNETE